MRPEVDGEASEKVLKRWGKVLANRLPFLLAAENIPMMLKLEQLTS